jgi:hypothetical protein
VPAVIAVRVLAAWLLVNVAFVLILMVGAWWQERRT